MMERHVAPDEVAILSECLPRDHGTTNAPGPGESDGHGSDRCGVERASAEARDRSLARVRELEADARSLRAVLGARNEAFRTLMARLVTMEVQALDDGDRLRIQGEQLHDLNERLQTQGEQLHDLNERLQTQGGQLHDLNDELRIVRQERDDAVALANALQNLKTLRYTRPLRDLYGRVRQVWGP
jgi:chromosome segregation ATPase